MREGAETHRLLQRVAAADSVSERAVSFLYNNHKYSIDLMVSGRIDILREQNGVYIVEEIKLAERAPEEPYGAHWAQAAIYAHMLAQETGAERVIARVLYAGADGQPRASFESEETREALDRAFRIAADPYCAYLANSLSWRAARDASLSALRFPFDKPRPGQRALAANTMRAIRSRKRLFVEAPTGIGKTCAVLYAAARALERGLTEKIFFLTARATARQAAWDALTIMRAQGAKLRSVMLTSREKCCPYARSPAAPNTAANIQWMCSPVGCPEAIGYFDRLYDALPQLIRTEDWTVDAIAEAARAYRLCPHELSLDLTEQADIILCDYNYAFDPAVQLRRIFRARIPATLLVDEAHHLTERARDMLSAALCTERLREARREAGSALGRKAPVYEALGELIAVIERASAWDESERLDAPPEGLADKLTRALDLALASLASARMPRVQSTIRDLFAMKTALDRASLPLARGSAPPPRTRWDCAPHPLARDCAPHPYAWLLNKSNKSGAGKPRARLTAMCLDPAQHLNAVTKPLRGCVYFSATLSPLSDMRAFLGGDADDAMLSLPSPFPQENLLILRRDHATSYSARASTTRAVADTLAVFARACRGNLWACFPSYAYMNAVRAALLQIAPELSILAQSSRMSEAERGAFLDAFYSGGRMMGMIALGGSFGESVDLVGDRLSGVAIVGVGLPQVGPEREILRAYYEERVGDGFAYAYRIPGMHKVVQAAGRVIRSADDRGAVLLIDDRYARDEYIELLPPHWRDIYIARDDDQLRRRLDEFWNQC